MILLLHALVWMSLGKLFTKVSEKSSPPGSLLAMQSLHENISSPDLLDNSHLRLLSIGEAAARQKEPCGGIYIYIIHIIQSLFLGRSDYI